MKHPYSILGLLVFVLLLGGCKKDDDYVYPSVITEILCARTGPTGAVTYLDTDRGATYAALNGNAVKGLSKDSTYRVYCVYERTSDPQDGANLYTFQPILSPDPIRSDRFIGGVKTDPVKPVSVWKSGDYINLSLDIFSQDLKKHRFHFVDLGVSELVGQKIQEFGLYHDQNGDTQAYFQTVYLSMPLRNYRGILEPGDLILFKINTFEGIRIFSFTY